MAIVLHFVWGVAVSVSADSLSCTPLASLKNIFGDRRGLIAATLVASSVATSVGLVMRRYPRVSMMLMLPQQALLCLGASGAWQCVRDQCYADGVVRPFAFMFCDQLPAILFAGFHGAAVVAHLIGFGAKNEFH